MQTDALRCLRHSLRRIRQPFRASSRRGLSLVELLVVIAVVLILLALLLPAIQSVRATARASHCARNLGQLHGALMKARETKVQVRADNWVVAAFAFADPGGRIYACPDDLAATAASGSAAAVPAVSYGINNRFVRLQGGESEKVVLLDYHASPPIANVVGPSAADDWPTRVAARHRGRTNVLSLDGSVRPRLPAEIDPTVCDLHDRYWRPLRDAGAALGRPGCQSSPGVSSSTTGSATTGSTVTTTTGTTAAGGTTTGSATTGTATGGTTTGSPPCIPASAQLLDDSDALRFFVSGNWKTANYGVSNVLHYANDGVASNSALWTYTGLPGGQYQVAASWRSTSNGARAARFTVTADGAPQSITFDQRNPPAADHVVDSNEYQNLASVAVTGGTLTVRLGYDGQGILIADAVYIKCAFPYYPDVPYCAGLKGEYRGDSQSFSGVPPGNNYLVRTDPSFNYPFGCGCATTHAGCLAIGVTPSPSGQPYPFPHNRAGNCSDANGNGLTDCLFTVRWTGQIKADYTETYRFFALADDYVRIWINGSPVMLQHQSGPQQTTADVAMTADRWLPITIEYANTAWADDFLYIKWSSPSMPERYLSAPNLRSDCP